jgi:single-stranded-DNA-specific exonuclease
MILHDKLWISRNRGSENVKDFVKELGITRVTAQILLNRGIDTLEKAKVFLNPTLDNLYDPFLLKGMDRAVDRIKRAIGKKESIWIYGDYDVDGVTSVSILMLYFNSIGYKVNFYIPDRFDEGYGINSDAIDYIKAKGGDLIISVDCGITSIQEVEYAKSLGIDFIITDHHQCQENIPNAVSVINPKRKDCSYPFDMLAGVGIAFKLIQALTPESTFKGICNNYLDIVALGTVADVAPLTDENRVLVKNGLEHLNNTNNVGLKALIEVCGLKDKKINAGYIGFVLAPKLNAAGRIKNASLGVKLLLSNDYEEALRISKELYNNNAVRQDIEKEILLEAEKQMEQMVDLERDKVIVLASENWHHGVIGIAASRIAEKYFRPTVLMCIEDGIAKGSARSVGDIDIFELLCKCKDMFIKFGGHAQAAGLAIPEIRVEEFRKKINDEGSKFITEKDLTPTLKIDMELTAQDIGFNIIEEIERLEPFGLGNPKPQFSYKNIIVENALPVGKDKKHLKMMVQDENRIFDCIGFSFGEWSRDLSKGDKVDLLFNLEKNYFKGVETIQFNLKDLRPVKGKIYEKNEIVHNYFLSFPNLINDLNKSNRNKDCEYVKDLRNIKNRSKFVIEKLNNTDSNLVLVNTLDGLIELIIGINDMDILEIHNLISFNKPNKKNTNGIVVNPILKDIDIQKFENILIYDIPINKEKSDFILNCGKKIYALYNKNDVRTFVKLLERIIPDRNDLAIVYKFLKENKTKKELSLLDLYKAIEIMNLSKIRFCVEILEDSGLLKTDKNKNKFIFELLPPPEKKINISATDLYIKINNLKKKFESYANIAFVNTAL